MAATTLSINRGTETQGYGTTSFYTSTNGRILNITIKASSTLPTDDKENASSISLTVTAGRRSITTESKIIDTGAVGYDLTFSIGIEFEEYTSITIAANCSNVITYYAAATYAHTGLTLTSGGAHNIEININYTQHWVYTMDDGYLAEAGGESREFRYFGTDSRGVPYNGGAWKIDFRNEGYPWLVIAEKTIYKGLLYYKGYDQDKEQTTHRLVSLMQKRFINGEKAYIPIRIIYKR